MTVRSADGMDNSPAHAVCGIRGIPDDGKPHDLSRLRRFRRRPLRAPRIGVGRGELRVPALPFGRRRAPCRFEGFARTSACQRFGSSRRQRARGQPRRSEDEASSRKASDAPCRLRPGVTRASRTSAAAEHAVSVVARSGGAAAARAPADPEGIRARSGTHATHADRASTRPPYP
jgi:hypothetical protein